MPPDLSAPPAAPARGRALRDRLFVAGAAALAVFAGAQVLDYGYGRDQGGFATVAHTILTGGLPYRNAWDFKPPAIYYIYVLAEMVLGRQAFAIRVFELLSFAAIVAACIILSREYLGDAKAGVLAGAFAVLSIAQLDFWHTAQAETFGAAFVLWGMAFAALGDRRPARFWYWVASGAAYGAAVLLKPTIGIAGIGTIGLQIVSDRRRDESWTQIGAVAFAWAAGAALPIAGCVAYFFMRGALTDLVDAALFAQRYAVQAWTSTAPATVLWSLVGTSLFHASVLNFCGLLLLATLPRPTPRMAKGLLHAAAVALLLLAGVAAQMRFFLYHFGAALPVIALLAGWGWWALWQQVRGRAATAVLYAVFLCLAGIWNPGLADSSSTNPFLAHSRERLSAWLHPGERQALRDRLYSDREYQARDNREAAAWIDAHTQADDRLFIFGFVPEIYGASGRRPASRYIYDHALRLASTRDAARAELMTELRPAPPRVVLVEHNDVMPFVNGEVTDSAEVLRSFPELSALLRERYARVTRVGRFDIYERCPATPCMMGSPDAAP